MFNRDTVRGLSADIITALQAVATKHGCIIVNKGGKFDGATFRPSIEFKLTVSDGKSLQDAERNEFERCARIYGLTADDYGRPFSSFGKTYRIVGLKPSSPKYPVIGESLNGRRYKFSVDDVTRGRVNA